MALRGLASLKRLAGELDEASQLIEDALQKVIPLEDRKLLSDLLLDRAELLLVFGAVPKNNDSLNNDNLNNDNLNNDSLNNDSLKKALALKRDIFDRMGQIRALHLLAQMAVSPTR